MKRSLLMLVTLGVVVGCAPTPPVHLAGIGDTSWQLVKFQGGDGTVLMPDDKAKYTVAFANDGNVSVRFDCNRGRGAWILTGPNQLRFGPIALTRAVCPDRRPFHTHGRCRGTVAASSTRVLVGGPRARWGVVMRCRSRRSLPRRVGSQISRKFGKSA